MNAVPNERPEPAEPVIRWVPGTGSGLSEILACVLPSVRARAGCHTMDHANRRLVRRFVHA